MDARQLHKEWFFERGEYKTKCTKNEKYFPWQGHSSKSQSECIEIDREMCSKALDAGLFRAN